MLDVTLLITLTGDLDTIEADQLRNRCPPLLRDLPSCVVLLDLSGITFLDAAGARAVLWLGHQVLMAGHEWGIIAGGNWWVDRVFRLLGWSEALPLYADWTSASLALRPPPS